MTVCFWFCHFPVQAAHYCIPGPATFTQTWNSHRLLHCRGSHHALLIRLTLSRILPLCPPLCQKCRKNCHASIKTYPIYRKMLIVFLFSGWRTSKFLYTCRPILFLNSSSAYTFSIPLSLLAPSILCFSFHCQSSSKLFMPRLLSLPSYIHIHIQFGHVLSSELFTASYLFASDKQVFYSTSLLRFCPIFTLQQCSSTSITSLTVPHG